jgi:Tol biopolymer transport system component
MLYDRIAGGHQELNIPRDLWKGRRGNLAISANGHYLVFESSKNDLVSDDLNPGSDIFVQTLATGEIRLVSWLGENYQFQGQHFNPSISADGRYIVFVSTAEREQAIYLYDAEIGVAKKVSRLGNTSQPVISDDGRFIVFASALKFDYEATERRNSIFVLEKTTLGNSYNIQSLIPGANDDSYAPAISGDGRYITFYSYADNLVADDLNQQADVFLFLEQRKVNPVKIKSFMK